MRPCRVAASSMRSVAAQRHVPREGWTCAHETSSRIQRAPAATASASGWFSHGSCAPLELITP